MVVVVASCNDDDSNYIPSYITELMMAQTNSDSVVAKLTLDDGRSFAVKSQQIKSKHPNALMRCYATISVESDGSNVKVYEITGVESSVPVLADSVKFQGKDPVNVVSVWKSGGYVNLCLAPLVNAGEKYRTAFCLDSISSRTAYVSFLFQRPDTTIEAYSTNYYRSIPLDSSLYPSPFDSLQIRINTYNGIKVYKFRD